MADVDRLMREVHSKSKIALKIIRDYIHITPLDVSTTFSKITGCKVYLKYENLQKTGSFKVRGALFKTHNLYNEGVKGIVTASAGNHAQGVAFASRVFGLRSIIVMPVTTPISKIEATIGYGAEVLLHGNIFDEAESLALSIATERNYAYIHPFNDIDVIAGQATIAWELLEQMENIDVVVVPIGGGGLASGIISVLKVIKPGIKIIGVEPSVAPKMKKSIEMNKIVQTDVKPSLADGLIVKKVGEITFKIISNNIDEIVTVDEDEIAYSMYLLLERAKTLVEGAGASTVAALLSGKIRDIKNKNVVAIISGGNADLTSIYRVIIRGLLKHGRMVKIYGYVPDMPGILSRVTEVIAKHRCNIVDIKHERFHEKIPPLHTYIEVLLEIPSREAVNNVVNDLRKNGLEFYINA
ncbi:MAG: threonine ammonia-lyase [Ignisphaera sp.]|nr:threonine ammonia-lyase [Ignisphaera sp.]MCX8168088.1 threonine ammonia-lyase [Ignisphaera sp.]MDW8085912.1 threonine ammonia-lyase [Ignisphaera sp.]